MSIKASVLMPDSTDRAFYALDPELRFVSAGPRALGLWNKSWRELAGRRLTEVFPSVEGGDVHRALLEALQSLRPQRLQTRSEVFGRPVEVEIYPVHGLLQVTFAPMQMGART